MPGVPSRALSLTRATTTTTIDRASEGGMGWDGMAWPRMLRVSFSQHDPSMPTHPLLRRSSSPCCGDPTVLVAAVRRTLWRRPGGPCGGGQAALVAAGWRPISRRSGCPSRALKFSLGAVLFFLGFFSRLSRRGAGRGIGARAGPAGGGEAAADLYGGAMQPFIYRALSLVPHEARRVMTGGNIQYLTLDKFFDYSYSAHAGLSRAHVETVAARVSAINQCFY